MRRELPEGEIAAEYRTQSGVTVLISDAAYAGISAAEFRRRRDEINRVAWEIAVRREMRRPAARSEELADAREEGPRNGA